MVTEYNLSETAKCLCFASRRAARAITRAFDRGLRPHGLRATQFSLLAVLALGGEKSIGELAETLGTDRTTLTRNLALVEEQSLIAIRPGNDARSRIVAITPKGRSRLTEALSTWRTVQSTVSAAIGGQTAESLRRLSRAHVV